MMAMCKNRIREIAIRLRMTTVVVVACTSISTGALSDSGENLAQELSNPISSVISVPFEAAYNGNIGPGDNGERVTFSAKPVVPITLNEDWNLVSRTIVPLTYQENIFPGSGHQFGLGDTVQSFFLSPNEVGPSGIIWGAGPVFMLPTATDMLLGSGKWGAGPTAVMLKQTDGLTVGALFNHIWSFAGAGSRSDVSTTLMQPFVSYTTEEAWTFAVDTDTTYNWKTDDFSVPLNFKVSKLTTISNQPVSFSGSVRYWAVSPSTGPQGFGANVGVTFLFPSK